MFKNSIILLSILFFTACSGKKDVDNRLNKSIIVKDNYINHFKEDYLVIDLSEDIEELITYLPKANINVRIRLHIANIEDVLYVKLIDDSEFAINKLIRRVADIAFLSKGIDGFIYEPSIEKNILILQLYIPHIYMYNGSYKPKLLLSYKRNSRAVQESIQLNFAYQNYEVQNNDDEQTPSYLDVKTFCENGNNIEPRFLEDIDRLSKQRDLGEVKTKLRRLCN